MISTWLLVLDPNGKSSYLTKYWGAEQSKTALIEAEQIVCNYIM